MTSLPERILRSRPIQLLPLIGTREAETPRHLGGTSENFGIEQIAKPDKSRGKADSDGKMVHNPHEIKAVFGTEFACKPNHSDEKGYGASVTGKSTLPRHKNLQKALPGAEIIFRLIENAVSESGSHYSAYEQSI